MPKDEDILQLVSFSTFFFFFTVQLYMSMSSPGFMCWCWDCSHVGRCRQPTYSIRALSRPTNQAKAAFLSSIYPWCNCKNGPIGVFSRWHIYIYTQTPMKVELPICLPSTSMLVDYMFWLATHKNRWDRIHIKQLSHGKFAVLIPLTASYSPQHVQAHMLNYTWQQNSKNKPKNQQNLKQDLLWMVFRCTLRST